MCWEWLIMPAIGASIGWLTNWFAIRMLFRPKHPVRLWGITIQGVLPRRREDLAQAIAETVERELLPLDELLAGLDVSRYEAEVVAAVARHVDERLEASLPPAVPPQLKRLVAGFARRIVVREATSVVRKASGQLIERVKSEVQLGEIVRAKVNSLDTDQLEKLAGRVAQRELRAIEVLGGVLGGLIGLAQAALFHAVR